MKNLLLTFATAALIMSSAEAQNVIGPKRPQSNLKQINIPSLNLNAGKLVFNNKSKVRTLATDDAAPVRNPKRLSYEVEGNEIDQSYGTVYSKFDDLKDFQVGYSQYFGRDLLGRLVGNRMGKIKFCAWTGSYSNARMVIWDHASFNSDTQKYDKVIWQKDITIKGHAINEVDCDFVIPDDDEFLDNGIDVAFFADVAADPNDTTKFKDYYRYVTYETESNIPDCSELTAYDKVNDRYGYFIDFSTNGYGERVALWIDTEGDASLRNEDASSYATSKARGVVGTTQEIRAAFFNMGLDSIKSVDYVCENGNRTVSGTAHFDKAIKLFGYGEFLLDLPLRTEGGSFDNGKFTITKVNGQDDEYTADNELNDVKSVSLAEAYKRTPVLESFTSTTNGWAPYEMEGLKKAAKAVDGKLVIASTHIDQFAPLFGYDPLLSDSYYNVAYAYADNIPSILINRDELTEPYDGIEEKVKHMANQPVEASMTFTPTMTEDGIQFNTKLNFTIDAPSVSYGLAYAVMEDSIKDVKQLNYFAYHYHNSVIAENPEDPKRIQWFEDLDDVLKSYATMESSHETRDDGIDAYWNYFTMNNVTCCIEDPMFNETCEDPYSLVLPAVTAGKDITCTYVMKMPTREGFSWRKYTSPVPAIKPENLKCAVYLIDLVSQSILTGCQATIGETATSNEKFDITGINTVNKAADAAAIADISTADGAFTVKADGAVAQVFDAQGRVVSSGTVNGVASLPTFGKGVFVVRVTKDGHSVSKKAIF